MNFDAIWAQIEEEQKWRTDEIRFFDNQASNLNQQDQDKFRRANILLLYSHYEGFCKFMFNVYVNAINGLELKGLMVNYSLVAASLDDVFKELRNSDLKAREFKTSMPDDKKLHLFARDKSFLEKIANFEERVIVIPDSVVDTESNLKPVVLRKNLFRLGFPHDGLQEMEGNIHKLLNIRNEISHGASNRGVSKKEYDELRITAFDVMNEIKRYVMDFLQNKLYLRLS